MPSPLLPSADQAPWRRPVKVRSVVVVPAALFLVGVVTMLLVGPLVAPKGFRGSILLELDFYLGLTLSLALVLGWVVVRLPRQSNPAFGMSTAIVAALFFVVMTATAYAYVVLNYETALAPSPLPATGGGWGVVGILLGFGRPSERRWSAGWRWPRWAACGPRPSCPASLSGSAESSSRTTYSGTCSTPA